MIKLHDFTKGKTAQFLSKVRNLTFEMFRNVELIQVEIEKFDPSKIEKDENGFTIFKNGEERMLLFYYKPHLVRTKFGSYVLPKYHVVECETRQEFGGFVFANKMPVRIREKEHNKKSFEKLELCKNCSRRVFQSWWGSNKPWYDSVLKYISEKNHKPSFFTIGELKGYHVMWRQISEAYRESVGFKCESCRIDLSNQEDRKWLHTHHKNGNTKDNRPTNFQALCLLCHSLSHKEKLTKGTGFLEVQEFIDNYKNRLNQAYISEYEDIKRNTGKKENTAEGISQQEIKELYQKVGTHHNENLKNILSNVQKNKSQTSASRLSTESNMYEQIVDNSYDYLVHNDLQGDIAQNEYYTRVYQDVINSFINETALDVSNVTYDVRTFCSDFKTRIEITEFYSSTEIEQFVDNFFNSHVNLLSDPVDVVSFTSFASTVKSSATFWFNYEEPLSAGRTSRIAARPPWKKLAFWDGVGALKGAWEFGKLGFVLGGGAGAFVVGATGAIFEGASASAAAYLEDRVESFFGL